MRYWIWWNDLIQGPFDLDELTSLRAFSEDLLVCMEDREEWLPVGRIADLASAVEQQKIARATPLTPPPPPPNKPPAATPLQGEFFVEPPGQQTLLPSEDEPKGPYAFRPVLGETETPYSFFEGQVTNPFHFSQQPRSSAVVLDLPRPKVEKPVVEKKHFFSLSAFKESPVQELKPAPEEKVIQKPAVSLKILQQEEALEEVQETKEKVHVPEEEVSVGRQAFPDLTSPYEAQPDFGRKLELLPWVMGVALALCLLVMGGYWVMDKVSTHSAITEANRLEPPAPMSLPATTPLPTPRNESRERTASTNEARSSSHQSHSGSFLSQIGKRIHSAITTLKAAFSGTSSSPAGQAGLTTGQIGMAAGQAAAGMGMAEPTDSSAAGASGSVPGMSPSAASAGGFGSNASGATSTLSSILQKLMNPMSMFKSGASAAGGAVGATSDVSAMNPAAASAGSAASSGGSQGGQDATSQSGAARSGDMSRNPASAGGAGSNASGENSTSSSWLQKLMNPMSLFKSATSAAGGASGMSAAQSGLTASQAGMTTVQVGASAAQASAGTGAEEASASSAAGATPAGTAASAMASAGGQGATTSPSGTAMSADASRSAASAGRAGSNASSTNSPSSSWLQKLSNPMSMFKSNASVSGGTAGAFSGQAGSSAEQGAESASARATGPTNSSSVSSWLKQVMVNPMSLFNGASAAAGSAASVHAGQAGAGMAAASASASVGSRILGALPGLHTSTGSTKSKNSHAATHRSKKSAIKKKPATGHLPHSSAKSAPHATAKLSHVAEAPVEASSQSGQETEATPPAEIKPVAAHLPGLSMAAAPGTTASAKTTDLQEVPPVDATTQSAPRSADPWAGRMSEAIKLVVAKTLPGSKVTVGSQAKTMLRQMHEKELMHAAETGERLYLPDKMGWAALQEEGARYRVYLNFQAMQENGERVQTRSYQFIVDLKSKAIHADDAVTEQDILTQAAELTFKHNPMATDIDSILGGVDTYNKHKVQMIIIKKSKSNRDDRNKVETALKTSHDKIQRGIIYFRRTYTEKALQNVAKAYNFLELANGK